MTTRLGTNPYKRHRFPAEIICHCVWLYFRFCLSYRDVEELMTERGVILLSALAYRQEMSQRFQTWREITGLAMAA
jgi:transposase-like protein